jgi:hypothetical protein
MIDSLLATLILQILNFCIQHFLFNLQLSQVIKHLYHLGIIIELFEEIIQWTLIFEVAIIGVLIRNIFVWLRNSWDAHRFLIFIIVVQMIFLLIIIAHNNLYGPVFFDFLLSLNSRSLLDLVFWMIQIKM